MQRHLPLGICIFSYFHISTFSYSHPLHVVAIGLPLVASELRGRTATARRFPAGSSDCGISSDASDPFRNSRRFITLCPLLHR